MIEISESEFSLLKKYFEDQCGINITPEKKSFIEENLNQILNEAKCSTYKDFIERKLKTDESELRERLIEAVTSKATEWYRDSHVWKYIEEKVVPGYLEQVEAKREVRILSIGASTGEEPYSLAILIQEETVRQKKPELAAEINIIGIDISYSKLFCAMTGRYDILTVQDSMPVLLRNKYFTLENRRWALKDVIKSRVKFIRINFQSSLKKLGSFDTVFCRYVLSDLSLKSKKLLLKKIARITRSGGLLILGENETMRGLSREFEIENVGDCIVNRRK